jgi:hypothetical protein
LVRIYGSVFILPTSAIYYTNAPFSLIAAAREFDILTTSWFF